MTDRLVLPQFSKVPQVLAEGFSEYFTRHEDFTTCVLKGEAQENTTPRTIGINQLIGMAGNCLTDEGEITFGCTMPEVTSTPLATATAFVDGYQRHVGPLQATVREARSSWGPGIESGIQTFRQRAIAGVEQLDMRSVIAFAIFEAPEGEQDSEVLIVPNPIVEDVPLQGRSDVMSVEQRAPELIELVKMVGVLLTGASIEEIEATHRGITTNKDSISFGLQIATLDLPSAEKLKWILGHEPQIGDFFELSGRERRTLLRQEQRAARKQAR